MTIEAKIIADSISPQGIRLTTMQLRYPRFIHAEFMTHRMFSRNASSSRAIPVQRMIEDLRRDPAMPVFWGSNKPGMQAGEELTDKFLEIVKADWLGAMEESITYAESMVGLGLHKQIANRILEPWSHINVVVTATDWENFYALRRHADAQPEIKALADAMWEGQQESKPVELHPGEWHLPYFKEEDWDYLWTQIDQESLPSLDGDNSVPEYAKRVSVARCARVSYLTHDGRQTTIEEDVRLYDRLVGSQPLHASPAEHQATPDEPEINDDCLSAAVEKRFPGQGWSPAWQNEHEHGSFRGWRQYRKMLPGENIPG